MHRNAQEEREWPPARSPRPEEPSDGAQAAADSRKDGTPKKREAGFVLLLTQSLAAVLILLFGLLLRLIGGTAYTQVREQLGQALADNRWVDAVLSLWLPPAEEPDISDDGTGLSGEPASDGTPAEQTAADPVSAAVCLPLGEGVLTSGYGMRTDPFSGERSFHAGCDIAAAEGTPIASVYDGTVEEAGSGGGYGNYLLIRSSPSLAVRSAHCARLLCREGDAVKAGDTVALVGHTGLATGDHLHIEWLQNGVPRNPARWIGGAYD